MFVSTIIPTINRPSLSNTVCSILLQDFPKDQFEVIVVNDSGGPLSSADWQISPQVNVIDTNQRNRSVARNIGAAIAKGNYLHFLDDDDWMMPGAFKALWELSVQNQAAWLYGAFRLVDDSGVTIKDIELNRVGNCFVHLMAGEWIPLQASFIKADPFFSIGGFAHLPSLLGGSEDIDFSRMMNLYFEFAYTSHIVASIRIGKKHSTTNYSNVFAQLRQSREKALNLPGSFSRMRSAANAIEKDSAYWNGQIVYFYLASMFHNFIRTNFIFTALSRAVFFILALLLSWKSLFKLSFWRGIKESYLSPPFR